MAARGDQIAQGWAASLTMGAGQFCTNPGVVIVPADRADAFAGAAAAALADAPAQGMLTDGIAQSFRDGVAAVAGRRRP